MNRFKWWSEDKPKLVLKPCRSLIHPLNYGHETEDKDLTINPYWGCAHRCVYCYATFDWFPDFYDKIQAKTNASEILEKELLRRRESSIPPVFIASATDCYQPAEGLHKLTRRCVEILQRFSVPYYIFTKSTSVLRDLDLHKRYREKCLLVWSITTIRDDIKRILEPNASSAKAMLSALEKASDAGVRTGVNMDPIIPGVTDDSGDLTELVAAIAAHKAQFVSASMLRLRSDIWKRIRGLLASLGWDHGLKTIEKTYFEKPIWRKGYFHADPRYVEDKLAFVESEAKKQNLSYGLPSTDGGGLRPACAGCLSATDCCGQRTLLQF